MEEIRIVKDDSDADRLLEQIKEAKVEIKRYETMATAKINEVAELLKRRTDGINYVIETNKNMLAAYFLNVKQKESKTQFSYGLLNGTLVMKKATQKIVHDDVKLLALCIRNNQTFVKKTENYKLDWAGFKKDLVIIDGSIINSVTGEVFETTEGLSIEEVKPSFDIK